MCVCARVCVILICQLNHCHLGSEVKRPGFYFQLFSLLFITTLLLDYHHPTHNSKFTSSQTTSHPPPIPSEHKARISCQIVLPLTFMMNVESRWEKSYLSFGIFISAIPDFVISLFNNLVKHSHFLFYWFS